MQDRSLAFSHYASFLLLTVASWDYCKANQQIMEV